MLAVAQLHVPVAEHLLLLGANVGDESDVKHHLGFVSPALREISCVYFPVGWTDMPHDRRKQRLGTHDGPPFAIPCAS